MPFDTIFLRNASKSVIVSRTLLRIDSFAKYEIKLFIFQIGCQIFLHA